MLLEVPKIADQAYFIDRGFAISYTFINGKKHIESFWSSGSVVLSGTSFFERVPSKEFIQLMEPSEVMCFSHASVLKMFDLFPESHIIYRAIMNQYYERFRERIHDLQHLTAAKRYQKLHSDLPFIEQKIPQDQIASYLGIAPQSLSRIKKSHSHP